MIQPIQVVIVGRPNVGKSTLFNRLLGKRKAIVHNRPGVTRDRIEAAAEWWVDGKSFPVNLVDTGGMGGDNFADEIENQVKNALNHADVILFLFDSQTGLTPLDEELLRKLNRSGAFKKAPLIAVVNKVDADVHEDRVSDFFTVGAETVLTVSAEHGRGMDDLKDAIAQVTRAKQEESSDSDHEESEANDAELEDEPGDEPQELEEPKENEEPEEKEYVRKVPCIAIVGRPNVGKSTLINAVLREDRVITSPIAGTTVDSVDTLATLNDKPFLFIDTAGIRRKSKTEQGIEVLSVVQTRKTLERAHVAILVLDGELGISDQDEKIGGLIEEAGCGVVLVVNKWDTQRKNKNFTPEIAARRIRAKMAYLKYAPLLFVSALKGEGLDDLGELLEDIIQQRKLKIPTHEFSEWVREEINIHNPMDAKFYLCHQSGRNPPTFVCHVSSSDKVNFSLQRHLVNAIRKKWGFMGSPIRMLFVEVKSKRTLPRKPSPKTQKFPTLKKKLKKTPEKRAADRAAVKNSKNPSKKKK